MEDKKKRIPAENFVGWISPDGNLEVVELIEKSKHSKYKVVCKICSQDKELFPDGYFISNKKSLEAGHLPCGCSPSHKWSTSSYIVKLNRVLDGSGIEYKIPKNIKITRQTRIQLYCNKHKVWWETSVGNVIKGTKCKLCHFDKLHLIKRKDEKLVVQQITSKLKDSGYEFIGFVSGYRTAHSYINFLCKHHGPQQISISNLLYGENGCASCKCSGYNKAKPGSLYITLWYNKNCGFIKFGITNGSVQDRVNNQKRFTNFTPRELFTKTWNDGRVAHEIESKLKKQTEIKRGVVDKDIFEDGYTETMRYIDFEKLVSKIEDLEIEVISNTL